MTTLLNYLNAVREIRSSGRATDERSYYPALAALFDNVGRTLTPRVIAIPDIKAQKDGNHPDFLLQAQSPLMDRAAVEVKGTGQEIDDIRRSDQVRRYLSRYGLTLVTNLRDFALVQKNQDNVIMRYSLAANEWEFWNASARSIASIHSEAFEDFLASVLIWDSEMTRPDQLAKALARFARESLRRLTLQPAEALAPLKKALSNALGLQFSGADGEHFFRSSLVQTLFYGLFSAWVAHHRRGDSDHFFWQRASDYLGLPLVRELFEKIAVASQLESLDIRKPLEWAEATLNRTNWQEFDKAFDQNNAVNYFYEPFLEAFDPQLRRALGVWYTPPEIVRYMVARVDKVLREELNVEDGLANPNVVILDPCCGTGAYLLETLRHIAATLHDKGGDALLASDLKRAAATRVFGFEIMPAPFVVAHLQIGSLLDDLGAPLRNKERAGVFLTNALTGWTPTQLDLGPEFIQLQHEAEDSARVKQEAQILVILGNPPYSGYAGTAIKEERELTDAYRTTRRAAAPQGQGLNDLYVRFYRMAERRIVETTGQGVICFISNYSWLDGLSFTGMREKYLDVFDQIWIDNLNGDKYRTGKLTPEGKPDPSVFSTDFNREGIQVGTAIATLVRREEHQGVGEIRFRSLWGTEKRGQLIESIQPSPPAPLPKERGETESEEYRQKATQAMALIARDLRRRSTSAEVLLWEVLRSRRLNNLKFRRQHPIANTNYVVDFLCYETRLVVELDGGIHAQQAEADHLRQQELEALGYHVIRFTNEEIDTNLENVLVQILAASTPPSPLGEGSGVRATPDYQTIQPTLELGYPFAPGLVGADYLSWPRLPELFPLSFPGVKTSRDDVVVDIDKDRLVKRMLQYFDPAVSHDQMREIAPGAMENSARFQAETVRDYLRKRGFLPQNIVRYCYRPFDVRWLYWEPETKLLDEKRAEYFPHVFKKNLWLAATQQNRRDFDPPVASNQLCSLHVIERGANLFPLYLKQGMALDKSQLEIMPNFSQFTAAYLAKLEIHESETLFYHIVAMLHAPAYRMENAGALRQDWPRIPLPMNRDLLFASEALGRHIAHLLDPDYPVTGVTVGSTSLYRGISMISRVGGGQLNPDTDLAVTAGWGYLGGNGVMPGRGRIVQRPMTANDLPAVTDEGSEMRNSDRIKALSDQTCDIYLNDVAYWSNIPLRVWEYTIGGYQVIKKWLSYREYSVLGRSLTTDEVREVTNIARRIAAILLFEDALDTNYAAVKAQTMTLE